MESRNLMNEEDLRRPTPRVRLKFLKSPVVGSADDQASLIEPELPGVDQWHKSATLGAGGFATYRGEHRGVPIFRKFEDASLLELFTDLFFAANYTVFTQTQQVTDTNTLAAYVGYFCTLWVTWLLVALYDVRFVTDCIFERATRAVHLGVLIGFAVVAPKFDPSDQTRTTMRIMSVILSISRFCLGVEYLSILWHVRKFKQAILPVAIQVGLSFVAGFIYLGITFRFGNYNSRVFIVWYIVAAFEMALTTGASAYWDVLAFTRTHLMKRLSLLTVIILGDGIIVLAQDVVVIVQTPNSWNTLTIGVVTAACAAIYSVFLVYFDWIREQYLPRWRQLYWVCLHLPFHVALVLFMHGFTQLIMWTKILDVLNTEIRLDQFFVDYDYVANSTSNSIAADLEEVVTPFFRDYAKMNSFSVMTLNTALQNITRLPDDIWSKYPRALGALLTNGTVDDGFESTETYGNLVQALASIVGSMYSALFETFGVEVFDDIADGKSIDQIYTDPDFAVDVTRASMDRFEVVFLYGYIASGLTLIMMVILVIISRKHPWTTWPIIRNVINVVLGLLMASLCALVYSRATFSINYILEGMTVPTLTIIWFFVLVLTHIGAARPVVNEAIKKRSTSSDLAEEGRHSLDRAFLSWHGGGNVGAGQMTENNTADAFPQAKKGSSGQTSFYGQIGDDGTAYGQRRGYSHDKDAYNMTPASAKAYGAPAPAATYNTGGVSSSR